MSNENTIMGVYLYKTKTFYYLDNPITGPGSNDVDKVKNTLMARDLIIALDNAPISSQYLIKSLAEARLLDNVAIEGIHFNNHTKKFSSSNKSEVKKIDTWD